MLDLILRAHKRTTDLSKFELESNRIISNGCRAMGFVFSNPTTGYDCFDFVKYERLMDIVDESIGDEEHF
jgi:hypothetical protein